MSAEIEKPFDTILSVVGPEWHGWAEVHEKITKDLMRQRGLFFPITSSETVVFSGPDSFHASLQSIGELCRSPGATLKKVLSALESFAQNTDSIGSHRTILGDLREVRPDLTEGGYPDRLVLHVPKASYQIIQNEEAFDTVHRVFGDAVKIVTAGTLRGCKVFFVSLDIGEVEYTGPRGDKWMQYLDVITSHDGTIGTRIYDSGTRIVCMNTLIMSLANKGNLDFTVYHSKNAQENLQKVSADLSAVFESRSEFFNTLGYFDTVSMSDDDARHLASFFLSTWKLPEGETPSEISTQVFNKADEVAMLFKTGDGNRGANAYDFFNAITQVYTWGSGTGRNAQKTEKFLASRDGTPAQIKEAAVNFLNRPVESLQADMEIGAKLYKEKALTR